MEKYLKERYELLDKFEAELQVKIQKQSNANPIQPPQPPPEKEIKSQVSVLKLSSHKQRARRKLGVQSQSYDLSNETIRMETQPSVTPISRLLGDSNRSISLSVSKRMIVPQLPSILEHENDASAVPSADPSYMSYQSPLATARESDTNEEPTLTARDSEPPDDLAHGDSDNEGFVEIELPDIKQIEKIKARRRLLEEINRELEGNLTDCSDLDNDEEDEERSICLTDLVFN